MRLNSNKKCLSRDYTVNRTGLSWVWNLKHPRENCIHRLHKIHRVMFHVEWHDGGMLKCYSGANNHGNCSALDELLTCVRETLYSMHIKYYTIRLYISVSLLGLVTTSPHCFFVNSVGSTFFVVKLVTFGEPQFPRKLWNFASPPSKSY